jgi:hypothetical protein
VTKWNGMQWKALALIAGLALSLDAHAQEAPAERGGSFGSVGQLVISADFSGGLGYRSVSGPGDEFFIQLRPSADYFIKENLSIGGFIRMATALRDGNDPLAVGVGLRGGYNIALKEGISVWPQLGLAVEHEDAFLRDDTYFEISLTAPFLLHLAPHFFVGGGPGLTTQIGDDTTATLGIFTVVGGYF